MILSQSSCDVLTHWSSCVSEGSGLGAIKRREATQKRESQRPLIEQLPSEGNCSTNWNCFAAPPHPLRGSSLMKRLRRRQQALIYSPERLQTRQKQTKEMTQTWSSIRNLESLFLKKNSISQINERGEILVTCSGEGGLRWLAVGICPISHQHEEERLGRILPGSEV